LLLDKNRDLQIEENRFMQSRLDVVESRALWYPQVDASINYGLQSEYNIMTLQGNIPVELGPVKDTIPLNINRTIGDKDRMDIGLDISYPLFTGLSRWYGAKASEAQSSARASSIQALKAQLSLRLGITYFQWELASHEEELDETLIRQISDLSIQVTDLHAAGIVPRSRVLEVLAKRESAKLDLSLAQKRADSLKLELMDMLSITDTSISPVLYNAKFLSQSDSVSRMFPRFDRAELLMTDSSLVSLDYSKKVLWGRRLPGLYFTYGYRISNPGLNQSANEFMQYNIAGLALKWNIYDGLKNYAQRGKLTYEMDILKTQREKSCALWSKMVAQAKMKVDAAIRMKAVAQSSLDASKELADELSNSMSSGLVESTRYLEAVSQIARSSYLLAQADMARKAATLQLLYGLGEEIQF
jgi:outer membrane protein TolC